MLFISFSCLLLVCCYALIYLCASWLYAWYCWSRRLIAWPLALLLRAFVDWLTTREFICAPRELLLLMFLALLFGLALFCGCGYAITWSELCFPGWLDSFLPDIALWTAFCGGDWTIYMLDPCLLYYVT